MIEQVQRRATRLVSTISNLSYTERLRELNLPTLTYRRRRSDMIQLFKIKQQQDIIRTGNHCNLCDRSLLAPSLATRNRGHSNKYQVQRSEGPRSNFFPARVITSWNSLTQATVDSKTINAFKSNLNKEWKNHTDKFNYVFSY